MATTPKPLDKASLRENRALARGQNLRTNPHVLSPASFSMRKTYLISAYQSGSFLKDPENRGKPPANPMSDPAGMDQMMGMLKGNMAMMIPNTLIMGWINMFFAGFVVLKLPFPLTIRFKSMLQSGVQTRDLDVRWVSSLSWYFLCLFGLNSVFIFILGNDNAASQMAQQMAMSGMASSTAAQPFAPGQDPDKMMQAEAENLEVTEQHSILDGVESRLLGDLLGSA
jgi:hypothetical protein